MKEKLTKLLSIIGAITCLYIIINGLASLASYIFLIRPTGDTLAAISWTNWFVNLIFSILLILIGLICFIDFCKTYHSKSVKIIKNSKRIIFSGISILILAIFNTLSYLFLVWERSEPFRNLDYFLMVIQGAVITLIIPSLIIILNGLVILRKNRANFKDTDGDRHHTIVKKRSSILK
jgi:hypothetical protein